MAEVNFVLEIKDEPRVFEIAILQVAGVEA